MVELTKEEEKWIKSLQRVCKKCPKSLWLYSNGVMSVMKDPEDGISVNGKNNAPDPKYLVSTITGIFSEGGDW